MGPLSLYFSLAYWVYPMKNIIGESGCYISFYWQTIGSFGILLQSFFVATFRYICLLHEDFLLGFSLSPTVSTLFPPLDSFLPWKISTHLYKVHIFWEGQKILRNLHLIFDWHYIGQREGEDVAKFGGLLRIYEFYCHQPEKLQHSFLCMKVAFIITFQFLKSENSLFFIQMVRFDRLRNPISQAICYCFLLLVIDFSGCWIWLNGDKIPAFDFSSIPRWHQDKCI